MRRALAYGISGAVTLYGAFAVGTTIRGPFADDGTWRSVAADLAVGLGVFGAAAAVQWAGHELARDDV